MGSMDRPRLDHVTIVAPFEFLTQAKCGEISLAELDFFQGFGGAIFDTSRRCKWFCPHL